MQQKHSCLPEVGSASAVGDTPCVVERHLGLDDIRKYQEACVRGPLGPF